MAENHSHFNLSDLKYHHKPFYFLLTLITVLLLYPFLQGSIVKAALLNLIFSLVLITGAYTVYSHKRDLLLVVSFGVPWLIVTWLNIFATQKQYIMLEHIFAILFFSYTTVIMLKYVVSAKKVDTNVLSGAIAVYLLVGVIFASVFTLTELLEPNAFQIEHSSVKTWPDFLFLSFATLTTTRYGDIVPISAHARSLAILEAVIGVLYIPILLSRLVGIYIMRKKY